MNRPPRFIPTHRRGPLQHAALVLVLLQAGSLHAQTPLAYEQGRLAFDEKRYRDAATLFATASREPNAPPDTLLREARSLISAGDPPAAEPPLRAYLVHDARSADALYLLGFVLHRENQPKASLEVYTRAAVIEPPHSNDLRFVALDYVLLDDYADAIHWLTRSVELDPENAEAWYDLGRSRMHEGSFPEAERALNRCLRLDPGNSKALDNLGLTLEAQNRPSEALRAYERAIAAQHASSAHASEQPLLNYGALLNTQNRAADAIAPLREAVQTTPANSRCHEELARAYLQTHQDPLALAEFQRAVALDPQNPRLHFQLGQLYRRAGDTAHADAELKLSASLYGSHSSAPGQK